MRHPLLALSLLLLPLACGTEPAPAPASADNSMAIQMDGLRLDAACGTCMFGMEGDACALALRFPGELGLKAWVHGTAIDDHGDAHAEDGFCNAVRQAVVSGTIEGGRATVTSFELQPLDEQG